MPSATRNLSLYVPPDFSLVSETVFTGQLQLGIETSGFEGSSWDLVYLRHSSASERRHSFRNEDSQISKQYRQDSPTFEYALGARLEDISTFDLNYSTPRAVVLRHDY